MSEVKQKLGEWRIGYADGSGDETTITADDNSVAKTNWGCGCCESKPSEEDIARAELIVRCVNSHEELVEALGKVPCGECDHPLRLHIDQDGCEFDRGDGYRMGSEFEVALGPCACHGGESDKKAIAALAKAGRP